MVLIECPSCGRKKPSASFMGSSRVCRICVLATTGRSLAQQHEHYKRFRGLDRALVKHHLRRTA